MNSSKPYFGIIPPLITPLLDRDTLDVGGLEKLLDHVIEGGVSGAFILGTTGEGPSLSFRLKHELIQRVCNHVGNRIPIFASITDTSFTESMELAEKSAESGVTAVVLTPPYYIPTSQEELVCYVKDLVAEISLPLMLYNMPSLTKVWFDMETIRQLSEIEQVIGVKDSGGDLSYFEEVCSLRETRPDWTFLIGPEDKLIESVSLGGNGGVNGGANLYPELFVGAYEAAVAGDKAKCSLFQSKIELLGKIYNVGKEASKYIKATKCAAGVLGICNEAIAQPFYRFNAEERSQIKRILEEFEQSLVDEQGGLS